MRVFTMREAVPGQEPPYRVLGASQRNGAAYSGAGVVVTWCIGHLVEAVSASYGNTSAGPSLPVFFLVACQAQAATAKAHNSRSCSSSGGRAGDDCDDAPTTGRMIAREIIDLCVPRADSAPVVGAQRCVDPQKRWVRSSRAPRRFAAVFPHSPDRAPTGQSRDGQTACSLQEAPDCGYTACCRWGRVQTPTLKLDAWIGDREIARFVSMPYWAVDVLLSHAVILHHELDAARRQHGCWRVAAFSNQWRSRLRIAIRAARDAQIVGGLRARAGTAAPPFDLGTLQEVMASRQLDLDIAGAGHPSMSAVQTHRRRLSHAATRDICPKVSRRLPA